MIWKLNGYVYYRGISKYPRWELYSSRRRKKCNIKLIGAYDQRSNVFRSDLLLFVVRIKINTHRNIHYTPYHSIWQGDFDAIVWYNVYKMIFFPTFGSAFLLTFFFSLNNLFVEFNSIGWFIYQIRHIHKVLRLQGIFYSLHDMCIAHELKSNHLRSWWNLQTQIGISQLL